MDDSRQRKRHVAAMATFIACGAVAALIAVLMSGELRHTPWSLSRPFEFPRMAIKAPDGDWIVADKGDRRISRLSSDGKLKWVLNGGSRSGGFYMCTLLGMDSSGRLWIDNSVLDEDGTTAREEILPIGAKGEIGPPVLALSYGQDERNDYAKRMYYVRLVGDRIIYFRNFDGRTVMRACPVPGGGDREVASIAGLDAYADTVSSCGLSESEALFFFPDGRLSRWKDGVLSEASVPGAEGGLRLPMPGSIVPLGAGAAALLDDASRVIAWSQEDGLRVAYAPADPASALYIPTLTPPPGKELAIIDQIGSRLYSLDLATGALIPGPAGASASGAVAAGPWIAWAAVILAAASCLAALVVLYVKVFRRRTPLLLKQLALFLPIVTAAVAIVSYMVFASMEKRLSAETETRLTAWAVLGSKFVAAGDVDALEPQSQGLGAVFASRAFARLTKNLVEAVNGNADPWNGGVYDYIYFMRDGQFYVFDQYGYFERYLPRPGMKETIEEGAARTLTYRDAYSRWYSCFAPVKDAEGRVAAIFEIAMDYAVFEEARNEFATGLARSAGLVALALAVAVAASTFILLKGIRGLAAGASLVAAGNYAAEVEITTRDEIADLGMAFNSMTREIKAKVGTIVDLNAANSKFVPARFLDALGKKSILDVRLGDQVEKDMAVLFADIRNFTDLSEKMSPEANFAFLNGYLERMGPLIREAGGFIDKYIGDAIMALFPDDPADAARAALGMHAALASFPGVQIGVGIHSGRLMLGIVGERERFDGTVISDVVNLASRLESLTKLYGVSALASGKAARAGGADLSFRLLDSVKVKGKSEETEIFELLPPGEDGADLKAASDRRFQEARRLYAEGDMASALAAFESLVEENPADKPAALFCRRCEGYLARGLPADWNGVTVFSEK